MASISSMKIMQGWCSRAYPAKHYVTTLITLAEPIPLQTNCAERFLFSPNLQARPNAKYYNIRMFTQLSRNMYRYSQQDLQAMPNTTRPRNHPTDDKPKRKDSDSTIDRFSANNRNAKFQRIPNISRIMRALSPMYLSTMAEATTLRKLASTLLATALANSVLPVPGSCKVQPMKDASAFAAQWTNRANTPFTPPPKKKTEKQKKKCSHPPTTFAEYFIPSNLPGGP